MLLETSVRKSNYSFTVNFRGFSDFQSEIGDKTLSPTAELGGYRWSVCIYPGEVSPGQRLKPPIALR
eukprot:gene1019-1105_t